LKKVIKWLIYLYIAALSIFLVLTLGTVSFDSPAEHVKSEPFIDGAYLKTSNIEAKHYLYPVAILQILASDGVNMKDVAHASSFSVWGSKKEHKSLLLTNDHFCAVAMEISSIPGFAANITYNQGDEKTTAKYNPSGMAYIMYSDSDVDLCLLAVNEYIEPVTFEDDIIEPLIPVKVVGAPEGTFPVVFDTYVSALALRAEYPFPNLAGHGRDYLFLSGTLMPGSSGSPVFNKHGHVIGIVFAAPITVYGGYAIQALDIMDWLDEQDINYGKD